MAANVRRRRISNVIGFDDAPFPHGYTGPVPIVGTVYARHRLNGVLVGQVEKDGADAATRLATLVGESKFAQNLQLIMLQGITLAGFNVVDVFHVHDRLGLPVLVVARGAPDLDGIRDALLTRVRGGTEKWAVIERLGPMEPVGDVFVQRVGLTRAQAAAVLKRTTIEGHIPEPLRVAHLIAGALVEGESRGRA